jgi:hypothetical protein
LIHAKYTRYTQHRVCTEGRGGTWRGVKGEEGCTHTMYASYSRLLSGFWFWSFVAGGSLVCVLPVAAFECSWE